MLMGAVISLCSALIYELNQIIALMQLLLLLTINIRLIKQIQLRTFNR